MTSTKLGRPLDEIKTTMSKSLREEIKFDISQGIIKCKRCKEIIDPKDKKVVYYRCQIHGTIFCYECMHNNVLGSDGKRRNTTDWRECTHCIPQYYLSEFLNNRYHFPSEDNCVYMRIPRFENSLFQPGNEKDG